MWSKVTDEVYETGVSLITAGQYLKLVQMIELELNWIPNKSQMIAQLKMIAGYNMPQDPQLKKMANVMWESIRGKERAKTTFNKALIISIYATSILGIIGGFIYLFRLVTGL